MGEWGETENEYRNRVEETIVNFVLGGPGSAAGPCRVPALHEPPRLMWGTPPTLRLFRHRHRWTTMGPLLLHPVHPTMSGGGIARRRGPLVNPISQPLQPAQWNIRDEMTCRAHLYVRNQIATPLIRNHVTVIIFNDEERDVKNYAERIPEILRHRSS